MFVVTVEFEVQPDKFAAFLPAMLENARASCQLEPGCRQFDVCMDETRQAYLFLYEVYDNRPAFETHRATEHFKRFDEAVRQMVVKKTVRTLERIELS